MDRIDAMKVFITAIDEGSLAGAARRLKRSPTAVSRALGLLEVHVGVELLHRTTRSLKLSEAGQRYAAACRRILTELEEADMLAGGERAAPRGLLTISAPPIVGEQVLAPILNDFLDLHPAVSTQLLLLDRFVNLVEEGVDIALRIGHLVELLTHLYPAGRRCSPGRRGVSTLSRCPSTYRRACRSCKAPDHRLHQFRSGIVEFYTGERHIHPADGSVQATLHCKQRARCAGISAGRQRSNQALFLPRRGVCEGWSAEDRARRSRASCSTCSSGCASWPNVCPEGPGLRRLRGTTPAFRVCTACGGNRRPRLIMPILGRVSASAWQFSQNTHGSISIAPTPMAKGGSHEACRCNRKGLRP